MVVVAACGSGSSDDTPAFAPGLVNPELGPCTATPASGPPMDWWPNTLPLPRGSYPVREVPPPGGDPTTFRRGFWVVSGTVEDFVDFALRQWPERGWILGVGEQERGEAEDTFLKGDLSGSFRVRAKYCDKVKSELFVVFGSSTPNASTVPLPTTSAPPP